jgi:hypothetical protein
MGTFGPSLPLAAPEQMAAVLRSDILDSPLVVMNFSAMKSPAVTIAVVMLDVTHFATLKRITGMTRPS